MKLILKKLITVTVYCYASRKTTLSSSFGTRIGVKPGVSRRPHLLFTGWTVIRMLLDSTRATAVIRSWHLLWAGSITALDIKIYDLNSNSWRVLDAPPDGQVYHYYHGISLKGDTYWFATYKHSQGNGCAFLVSFDFTKEIFGPLLHFPFEWYPEDIATLSSVKEEKLAVLFQRWDTLELEIWITTEIKPNAVSWNTKVFLAVEMRPFVPYQLDLTASSFIIDEEKKVAVVFSRDYDHNMAFIIGVDGSFKKVYLGEVADQICHELAFSYVPSSMQLN